MSGPEVVLMTGGGLGSGVSRVSDVSLLTDFDLRLPSGLKALRSRGVVGIYEADVACSVGVKLMCKQSYLTIDCKLKGLDNDLG